jgi:2-polyprenyl-3-methyl-5-hydroxy-6-metoxy-1,4-benzoquinol methylase
MRKSRGVSRSCPLCGGASRHAFSATDRNHEITREHFEYGRCQNCGTVFIVDIPEDLARYYATDYYHFGPDGEPGWKSEEPPLRDAAYRIGMLQEHVSGRRLIEIGSGTGAFAVTAKNAGFDVSGIEMNERCCQYLRDREGINAICSDRPLDALSSLPRANVIAMWHVLEHLQNPTEVLARLAERLEPGGVLAIAVPNPRSLQFRLLRKRWAHLDAPRHLCLIPPETLVKKGKELGLSRVAMTTNDPNGFECNLFGWNSVLWHRPATGMPPLVGKAALAICVALAPIERTGHRGAAVTLLMRKEG